MRKIQSRKVLYGAGAVALLWASAAAGQDAGGAISIEIDGVTTELRSPEGSAHEYDSPLCNEARRRAENRAQVPGFDDEVQQILSAVPECFVGWEPGQGSD